MVGASALASTAERTAPDRHDAILTLMATPCLFTNLIFEAVINSDVFRTINSRVNAFPLLILNAAPLLPGDLRT